VAPERQREDPAERELFETIKGTYALVEEPEQRAMIKELRSRLTTISSGDRMSLIDAIENAISQNMEWQELEL
jgi:hypothetical protein